MEEFLKRRQYYAWAALLSHIFDEGTGEVRELHPFRHEHLLLNLVELLRQTTPLDVEAIQQIHGEALGSGIYESVMECAGIEPDPRIYDQEFRALCSQSYDLGPGGTLWDNREYYDPVLSSIRRIDNWGQRYLDSILK